MRVFCDYIGHADLDYSIHRLFEERLGWEVYRPDRQCWQTIIERSQNYPKHKTLPPKPGEVPVPHYVPHHTMPMLANHKNFLGDDGVLRVIIPTHHHSIRFVNFEQFDHMKFDVLLTTYWGNESTFCWLQEEMQPCAKLIRQIANVHEQPKLVNNVLLGTCEPMGHGVNYIIHHPEHPPWYCASPPQRTKRINSFLNNLRNYPDMVEQWTALQAALPDYKCCEYGMNNRDGSIPQDQLYKEMQKSMFVWHSKPLGCCGYVAREALACGRPIIANKSYARQHHTLATNYLDDLVNFIDTDPRVRTMDEVASIVRSWSEPGVYEDRCDIVTEHCNKKMNFAREAKEIRAWIDTL